MLRSFTRITRVPTIRQFSTTTPKPFITNFFGKKDLKKREEIVKNQDDFESDSQDKITILTKENSPNTKKFDPEVDMADFKINQWKDTVVREQDLEATYNSEQLSSIFNQTYQELKGETITSTQYPDINLFDLNFRFQFAKALQQKLGFDFNDYTLTKSHTLNELFTIVNKTVSKRYVNERNPNGVVLRSQDFNAANIYLKEERTPEQQQRELTRIAEKAREEIA